MRIQILNLPGAGDDYPFALVIDQANPEMSSEAAQAGFEHFKNQLGAKAVLVTNETVEVDF